MIKKEKGSKEEREEWKTTTFYNCESWNVSSTPASLLLPSFRNPFYHSPLLGGEEEEHPVVVLPFPLSFVNVTRLIPLELSFAFFHLPSSRPSRHVCFPTTLEGFKGGGGKGGTRVVYKLFDDTLLPILHHHYHHYHHLAR